MGPGSIVVLLADPWERGVGHIVSVGSDGLLLVDWANGEQPSRTWHHAQDLERFDAWLPALSAADMIALGALPPRDSA